MLLGEIQQDQLRWDVLLEALKSSWEMESLLETVLHILVAECVVAWEAMVMAI